MHHRFFASLRFAQNDKRLCLLGGVGWRRSRQPTPPLLISLRDPVILSEAKNLLTLTGQQ
ncbi:MAG: hypothetical protein K8S00_04910 [Bacteroidales bacterium]|nr:hypothetical protein [Bacteroidales bacterium]